ncbi:hypothetical protein [Actinacidiphila guanduensis]|uniref:Integral membrane protein n=1 Tax=Actinacidiphila guanduensis TaxID=310781 RepID=A0A1H0EXY4_9ACTN|nr:hypothetical protein [Actinacidiphila guanduensis]SDN87232.1 hypothetical protein SAMN05216259_10677 [Actinacidiphila guanduensis]
MYGPGQAAAPPKPANSSVAVLLRVVFTVLPIVSLGFLAWGGMLYLAVLGRRTLDWLVLAVTAGMGAIAFVCFAVSDDDNDWQANTGGGLIITCMFAGAIYFLAADIRRRGPDRRKAWPPAGTGIGYPAANPYATGLGMPLGPATGSAGPIGPQPGYPHGGYPVAGPVTPATPATPVPGPALAQPHHQPPQPAVPPISGAAAGPPPGPRKIDQVRAELDELSDYLRKERDQGDRGRREDGR